MPVASATMERSRSVCGCTQANAATPRLVEFCRHERCRSTMGASMCTQSTTRIGRLVELASYEWLSSDVDAPLRTHITALTERLLALEKDKRLRSGVGAIRSAQLTASTKRLIALATQERLRCIVGVFMCTQTTALANARSHSPHVNGLSPLWVRSRRRRFLFGLIAFSQSPHTSGPDLLCAQITSRRGRLASITASAKGLVALEHTNGFAPLWMRACSRKMNWHRSAMGAIMYAQVATPTERLLTCHR
jgi:hypothetical protein